MTSLSSTQSLLLRSIQIIVVLGFFIYVVAFVQNSMEIITHPWSVDYGEAPELNRALRIAQGKSIYTDWDTPPFLESNYTPLFTWIHSFFVDVTQPSFWKGRLLNCIFTMCTAGIIVRIIFCLSVPLWQGILGGMVYLSSHIVWMWAPLLRVDSFAVLCNIAALWIFIEPRWKKQDRRLYLIALLCLCAAFARQTMIASLLSIVFVLFWENKRQAFHVGGLYAIVGLIAVGLLLWGTDGNAYAHLVLANVNEFSWTNVGYFFGVMWKLYHGLLPAVLIGLWVVFRKSPVILCYALCSLLVSLTIGKVGASLNYLLELWVAISILCALGAGYAERIGGRKGIWLSFGVWCSLLVGWQQMLHFPWSRSPKPQGGLTAQANDSWDRFARWTSKLPLAYLDPFGAEGKELLSRSVRHFSSYPGVWERDGLQNIEENLSKFPGLVLSEDMNCTVGSGRMLWIQPFEFVQLAKQGIWSEEPLHSALDARTFSALILLFDVSTDVSDTPSGARFSKETRVKMKANYELVSREGLYWVYLPKTEKKISE